MLDHLSFIVIVAVVVIFCLFICSFSFVLFCCVFLFVCFFLPLVVSGLFVVVAAVAACL